MKNEELKHLSTAGSIVSFKSSRKISSSLVRAKLYLVERSVGSFNCKRPRCQICAYVNEADSFFSTVTGETYKNNRKSNSRKYGHGISCMQDHLYENFCDSEHSGFLNNVSITFMTKPTLPTLFKEKIIGSIP